MTWRASQILAPVETGQPGYHMNMDPALYTDALAPFVVTPAAPVVVFAGQDTVFLRFPDEQTARLHLGAHWITDTDEG